MLNHSPQLQGQAPRLILGWYLGAMITALATAAPPMPPEKLATLMAEVIREAIPPNYEKRQDWGKTKRITSGLEVHGKLDTLRFERRKKEVRHGVWKHYRVELVEPAKNLRVAVRDLNSIQPGRAGFTLEVETPLAGWAQVRSFNRGVHFLTITGEGTSHVNLLITGEVGVTLAASPAVGLAIDLRIISARVDLADFDLNRLGKLHGDVAHELGSGLKKLVEQELDGPALTAKLNRAIDKKRDRLVIDAAELVSR